MSSSSWILSGGVWGTRRERGKEFLEAIEEHTQDMLLRSFSLMGLRSDADFMLWRIGYDLDAFEKMMSALMKTGLGRYLTVTYSYFALSRRSIYVGEHTPGFENRRYIVPGEATTFSSTLSSRPAPGTNYPSKSASVLDEHMKIGRKHYP